MTEEPKTIPLKEIGKIGTVNVYNQVYVDKQQKKIEELEKENVKLKKLISVILANKKLIHIRNFNHLSSIDIEALECALERWFIEAEDFIEE